MLRNCLFLQCVVLIAMHAFAQRNQNDGNAIILRHSGNVRPHMLEAAAPTAGLVLNRNVVLTVNLDQRYFSSYTINLLTCVYK